MPKEVEAVVLETTALNCPCTLNVHERIVQQKDSVRNRKDSVRNRKDSDFLHRKEKGCSDCGRDFNSSNWSYTLKH